MGNKHRSPAERIEQLIKKMLRAAYSQGVVHGYHANDVDEKSKLLSKSPEQAEDIYNNWVN